MNGGDWILGNLVAAVERGGEVDLPVDLDAPDESGLALAQRALERRHPGALRLLLERGAALGPLERLSASAVCGDSERVRACIDGVDLNRADRFHHTPLMYAVLARAPAIVELLLARGADPEVATERDGNILHTAASNPDPAVFELLIRTGADVNRRNQWDQTPLMTLLSPKRTIFSPAHFACARQLVEAGAWLHYFCKEPIVGPDRSSFGDTGLVVYNPWDLENTECALLTVICAPESFSCSRGAALNLLLAAGEEPLIRARGTMALLKAVHEGCVPALEALLDAGASPGDVEVGGVSPVALAAKLGSVEVLSSLLRRGARIPEQGQARLRRAEAERDPRLANAIDADDLAAVNRLLDTGLDPNIPLPNGEVPLSFAAVRGRPAVVRALAARGASLDEGGGRRASPLHAAVRSRQLACIRALIELGCQADGAQYTSSPLSAAAAQGDDEVVRLLLDAGANPSAPDDRLWTPLELAAAHGRFATIALLCSRMNDPRTRREALARTLWVDGVDGDLEVFRHVIEHYPEVADDRRVLSRVFDGAAAGGSAETLRYLLARGACSAEGFVHANVTPLMSAVRAGELEAVRVLVEAGANVRARQRRGQTPLMFACHETRAGAEHPQIVHFLLAHGAELDARTDDGRTALMMAVRSGAFDVVEALVAHGPDLSPRDPAGRTALDLARASSRKTAALLLRPPAATASEGLT